MITNLCEIMGWLMTTARYDDIAEWYNEQVRVGWGDSEGVQHERSALSTLIGDIEGQDICDLGCGQGAITRWLARAGAKVVGIDISERLLGIANQREQADSLGITYVLDDAQLLRELPDNSFDGVVCTWSLLDIENLSASFKTVARILRPVGWFVFLITHPCFHAPGSHWEGAERLVGDYFGEGFWRSDNPKGVRGNVGAYHRTLSTYFSKLVKAGFIIERLVEPQGTGDSTPDTSKVPAFLAVRCTIRQV